MRASPRWPGPPATVRVFLVAALTAGAGCGKKGPPVPPEPRGPTAPASVVARQIGDEVVVAFRLPEAKGGRAQQQPVAAELLRVAWPPGPAPPADAQAFRRRGESVARTEVAAREAGSEIRLTDDTVTALENGGSGWTLRYAVRVEDARGRLSPPGGAPDLEPLPPASAPRNLVAEPTADGIRLSWEAPERLPAADTDDADADAEPAAPNYHVYRTDPGEPFPSRALTPGPQTAREYLDGTIVSGNSYAYSVRVVLAAGSPPREGHPSPPVVIEARDTFAPAAPEGLVVVQEGAAIRLFWNPNREADLAGYRVYRRVDGAAWRRIGPDPVEPPTFIDRDVTPGVSVAYRVTAVDRAEGVNESESTPEREVVVVADPAGDGRP